MNMDYYQTLGVARDASEQDIKKSYRKLAHKYHPDKGGDEKKFKELNEAYQVLSNKQKRAQYDKFGRVFEGGAGGFDPSAAGFDFGSAWPGAGQGVEFDIGDLGEIFGDFFGGAQARKKNIKRGQDIQVDIEIALEHVLTGKEEKISLYKTAVCDRCHGSGAEPGSAVKECFTCRGTGEVQQVKKTFLGSFSRYTICPECKGEGTKPEKLCNVCKGEGRIKKEKQIKIFIPAGVDTNQVIKINREGQAGKRGGEPGDLYIRILVKKHSLFSRRGDDIFLSVPITFSQACLGDEIEIPTLEGKKIELKIPAGTESGKVLRLSKKGIPHFSGWGRGSMYVELIVKTPKKLSKKQKELLEQLKEEGV
ncbi:hypothetical protein AMJ49_06180 [Parcubacteria bacterium DG_74_2]|nr:MAG: hypothetical protein AMJ49_06180 [Parcubacteria bacterium DG_74_2]